MMLQNSRAIKVQNLRSTDLITNNLENRMEDADAYIRSLLAQGYVIYDVAAHGGFGTVYTTPGVNILCVFVNADPAGPYSFDSSFMYGHSNVVLTGIRLDSGNNVVKHSLAYSLTNVAYYSGGNYTIFAFANITFASSGQNIIQMKGVVNSTITMTYYVSFDVNHLIININSTFIGGVLNITNSPPYPTTFQNCVIRSDISTPYATSLLALTNCLLHGTISIWSGSAGIIDLTLNNVYLDNAAAVTIQSNIGITCLTGFNIVNAPYNASLSGAINALSIIRNNTIYWYNDKTQIVTSYLTSTTNFVVAYAHIAHQRKSIRGPLGTIKRNYYNIQFDAIFSISDSLKYNDDGDLMLVWRDALETEFTTDLIAKIKNYQFYKSDGTTLVSTYRNAESFLILAQRVSDSSYTVFAWHKGMIWATIYGEVWRDSLYTIIRCFQIWEHPEEVSLLNLYTMTDSPVEATYLMQDATSKVVRV